LQTRRLSGGLGRLGLLCSSLLRGRLAGGALLGGGFLALVFFAAAFLPAGRPAAFFRGLRALAMSTTTSLKRSPKASPVSRASATVFLAFFTA
jgi:hypothetical protein